MQKITVLGLGGAGCRAIGALNKMGQEGLRLLALDTDKHAVEATGLPAEQCMLAAPDWRGGRGCGGNVLDGQRAIARERVALETFLADTPMLLVLGGLGGGTASGGAAIILSIARKLEIPTLFLLTMPFTLEGHSRRRVAEETLRTELLEMADVVLALPNDLLFSALPATTPLADAFALADREVAGTALALTSVLRQGNLLAVDFNDMAAIFRRRKSFCSLGVGIADTADGADGAGRCRVAFERMLQSPLLGGADHLVEADAVFFSLIGGSSLGIGETRDVLELASSFVSPETRVMTGASTDPSFGDRVQLCALTVKFDRSEEVDQAMIEAARPERASRKGKRQAPSTAAAAASVSTTPAGEAEQLMLSLSTLSKGIMENTTAVVWSGENLDYPTFQRRNIAIDAGKTVTASELRGGQA
ncbi:MAG: hypothetical protein AB7F32_11940 [Victivallaceae bacterium]